MTMLAINNYSKAYNKDHFAVSGLSLNVDSGDLFAFIGHNGAGKTTTLKAVVGILQFDKGEVFIKGESIRKNPLACKQKIAYIPDNPDLYEFMSGIKYLNFIADVYGVGANQRQEKIRKYADLFEITADLAQPIAAYSHGMKQKLAIISAWLHDPKLIIMDEPTSSLTEDECKTLFRIVERLKRNGITFIFISHKMDEIKRIADDITIMRDGTYVGTWPAAELSTDQIIAKMVGRELTNVYPPKENKPGEVIMEVKDLCSIHEKSFQHVSFELRKGEILGFGGLVGAQRTELMEGIFGIRGIASGEIYMHGKKTRIKHPIDAMNAGIGLITEDRRGNGIFGCLSIKDNVGVSVYNKFLKAGFVLDHKKINQVVDDSIKKLSIKTPSMKEHIANLSGGNQQKVIVARWLANDPDVLIMDEPTRGIDVGAKHEIYEIMSDLAKQGKAIIMISSEMSELLGMADRICVMCNGKLTGEIDQPEEMTQARVMGFATKF